MADKILATFRVDSDKWEAFKSAAGLDDSNASAVLLEFIDWYLDGNRLTSESVSSPNLDGIDSRIDKLIDDRMAQIDKRIDERIDDRMVDKTAYLSNSLNDLLGKVYERIEALEGKLKA